MANPDQLAKTLAQDVMDLDALFDEARRALLHVSVSEEGQWYGREDLDKILREMPAQLYTVSVSLLAYAEAVDDGYLVSKVLKERMVLQQWK